jgi:hypothetical protein
MSIENPNPLDVNTFKSPENRQAAGKTGPFDPRTEVSADAPKIVKTR